MGNVIITKVAFFVVTCMSVFITSYITFILNYYKNYFLPKLASVTIGGSKEGVSPPRKLRSERIWRSLWEACHTTDTNFACKKVVDHLCTML